MKVGIIGAGSIAGTMAGTIREMDCAQNYAVAARDYGRAAELRKRMVLKKPMDLTRNWWRMPGWS